MVVNALLCKFQRSLKGGHYFADFREAQSQLSTLISMAHSEQYISMKYRAEEETGKAPQFTFMHV